MLKIEDLKVGDELVCVDERQHIFFVGRAYKIKLLEKDFVVFEGATIKFRLQVLRYFKKKEQSQYTFDDLVDISRKAVREKVARKMSYDECGVLHLVLSSGDEIHAGTGFSCDQIIEKVERIKSLYKETFVIESEEDCKRIKQNAKITFLNGNSVFMDNPPTDDGIVRIWNDGRYDFIVLKGATVEQERS